MPTAGDEGYETLIVCPYDKSHEIRKGRIQFHLEKCRRNFPNSQLVECPYNKSHLIHKAELNFHMEEECDSRATWDLFTHERDDKAQCPVKDLVPVNAATVPDGGENWDDFEADGSVLNQIRAEAAEKPIVRMLQVASKAQRKAFRIQERQRHEALGVTKRSEPCSSVMSDTSSVVSVETSLPKPTRQPNIPVVKQDPNKAVAVINKQFRNLNVNTKLPTGDAAFPETSSGGSFHPPGPSFEIESASTSRQIPFSYAAASRGLGRRPGSAMSGSSIGNSTASMMTALTSDQPPHNTASRPSTGMSNEPSGSFFTASQGGTHSRPLSAMSHSSLGNSSISSMSTLNSHRPPNSTNNRQSAAMSIANSAATYNRALADEDGFCQIPIPGLGRGRRRPIQ